MRFVVTRRVIETYHGLTSCVNVRNGSLPAAQRLYDLHRIGWAQRAREVEDLLAVDEKPDVRAPLSQPGKTPVSRSACGPHACGRRAG